jgi:RNA polymerase sigma factor (TIGR02999 family)
MRGSNATSPDVTQLLAAWSSGRREALDRLLPVIYGELRKLARGQLSRARRDHTFQPTELVHEAFMKLVDQRAPWQNRTHFYGIAATCMRRILADHARRKRAAKRPQVDGGVDLDQIERADATNLDQMVAVDEALDRLAKDDPRVGRIAELKLFTDLQLDEIATLVGVSSATVKRDWASAKQTLHAVLGGAPP